MVKAMAETVVGRPGAVKPQSVFYEKTDTKKSQEDETKPSMMKDEDYKKDHFENLFASFNNKGVQIPKVNSESAEELEKKELLVFHLDPRKVDLYPDPMLLLMKAAINWSMYCDQELFPVYDSATEDDEDEESVATPIPTFIYCAPVRVTPD
ncbi:MAG: hypothetical protein SGILL_009445 [Bacillariaceae sp.]